MSYHKRAILITLFSSLIILISGIDDDQAHADIFYHLMRDFREVRHNNQYCVLYVPPPNARRGQVQYAPRRPQISTGSIICPEINLNDRTYPQNYAGVTVDINGNVFGPVLHRSGHYTIHTEDLALNVVYPPLQNWYLSQYDNTAIRNVYLYTYFLPCTRCFDIIRQFVTNNTQVRMYVGYTQLIGGMRENNNVNAEAATRQRRNDIHNFLNDNRGSLLQIEYNGQCRQPGNSGRFGRDSSDICPTTDTLFVITMDFQNGKAEVWFNAIAPDYNGWVELVDGNDKRITWEWTWQKTQGKITFNAYIGNGMNVRYWKNNGISRTSYKWYDCGFNYVNLNKLPYYDSPPLRMAKIKLSVEGGYVTVYLRDFYANTYTSNGWDFVMIQTFDQIGTESYKTYQWVSHFSNNNFKSKYYKFSISGLENGFRAKYVFYDGTKYRHEGVYENASPVWIPGECQGTS